MKVAIVHDYIKEFGGAERVLEALCEIYPDAPIYTAFYDKKGTAFEHFKHKKIIPSWARYVPFFASKLHSPLRFLAPLIWGSFEKELQKYDVIISSASWYVTKGFGFRNQISNIKNQKLPLEICYCHTPPRWLYGYTTSVNLQKYWPVKVYAAIVGHFMRLYDFKQAQKVDYFIANSNEVRRRIEKFYRRDAIVIYPPVELPKSKIKNQISKKDYYLIVARLTGSKGLELAIEVAEKMGFKLKIAGSASGYYFEYKKLTQKSQGKVEFLGQVTDEELVKLYKGAKAFLALSKDEDFGITPVEAMSLGTPVIAYNGGGYKETVVSGKTGLLFDDYSVEGLIKAIKQFSNFQPKADPSRAETINSRDCINQAEKFGKERFEKEIKELVTKKYEEREGAV